MAAISSLIALLSYTIALCGAVPLFPWLSIAPRLLLVAGLAAGVWQSLRSPWPIKNWLLNASIVPVFLYYAAQFSRSNVVQPVVNALAIMLAARLLGEKNGRHHLQIMVLSLFCLAASSLFDVSPLFLVYLALLLVQVALSLVLLAFYEQDSRMLLSRRELRQVVVAGLLLPLASLPLLIFFFPLLPRTPIPLWNLSIATASRTGGFSDKVEPGLSPDSSSSPVLAFRAELPRQPQQQLYWRGTVFNRYEENRWVRVRAIPPERLVYGSSRVTQFIYPEPGLSRFLIALDAPAGIAAYRARANQDGTVEMPFAASKRLSYRANSFVGGILPVRGGINRAFYLELPATVPAEIMRVADGIRTKTDSDGHRLELLEQYFRAGGYSYAMQGLPTGEHALEQFLFIKKRGHCEFFASAFALLARAAGVPTRLVGGYLGGEYNEVGGYYLVTESMAHVWVEAFVSGRGWLRIDPSSFARNAGAVWGTPPRIGFVQRLRLVFDSLDHAWNRSVIGYDFEQQVEVARSASRRLQTLTLERLFKRLFVPLSVVVFVVLVLLIVVKRRFVFPSREERLLRNFYRHLEKECGLRVQAGRQGLFDLARLSNNERVGAFVSIYAGALYRDRKLTDDEYCRLRMLLRSGFGISRSDPLSE
ncbi:MAG: DUF3488 domain-containing protein [Desulfuromonadales bacterium]|nr:DUF3488 domain-containing protein [Desulfuromonadales bacterium]